MDRPTTKKKISKAAIDSVFKLYAVDRMAAAHYGHKDVTPASLALAKAIKRQMGKRWGSA